MPAGKGGQRFESQVDGQDFLGLLFAVQPEMLNAQLVDVLVNRAPDDPLEKRLEMGRAVARSASFFMLMSFPKPESRYSLTSCTATWGGEEFVREAFALWLR